MMSMVINSDTDRGARVAETVTLAVFHMPSPVVAKEGRHAEKRRHGCHAAPPLRCCSQFLLENRNNCASSSASPRSVAFAPSRYLGPKGLRSNVWTYGVVPLRGTVVKPPTAAKISRAVDVVVVDDLYFRRHSCVAS
jgi:hypothetical protein